MSNSNFQRLNYTNVVVSNENLDVRKKDTNATNNQFLNSPNLKVTYEKSNIKGSNTNLNRLIRNKNLNNNNTKYTNIFVFSNEASLYS